MKSYSIFILFLGLLFFSSCDEDFFEATVNVEVPEHTPALAITSEMFAGDTAIAVYVSQSAGILEDLDQNPIKDATVELFKNGELIVTLPYFELAPHFYVDNLPEPLSFESVEYELKVSAPSLEPVSSKQIMPKAVEILSAEYDPEGAVNSEGDRVDEFTIEFQDPPGEENFYRLQVWRENEFFTNDVYLENLEPLAEEYDGNIYLKDSSIDGKKYTWRVGTYPYFSDPAAEEKFRVELFSITRDQYLFARSASLSYENDDNPFAEPVIVHGNIEGGNGIFSLGTKDVEFIER